MAFFRRCFGQSYRNLHKFCSFWWGTKICPNWHPWLPEV